MIAIKKAIIYEISAMQLLPVLINGLPHLALDFHTWYKYSYKWA